MNRLSLIRRIRTLAVMSVGVVLWATPLQGADRFVTLYGARVLLPNGELVADQAVVLRDRTIELIHGTDTIGDVPNPIHLAPGSVVSPILTDLGSALGCHGQAREQVDVIDADARVASAFDPFSEHLDTALSHGITRALLVPEPFDIVSGRGARLEVGANRRFAVSDADGPLVFAIGDRVLRNDGEPTSSARAAEMLDECLERAARGQGPPAIGECVRGQRAALVYCDATRDVRAALRAFARSSRYRPVLVHRFDRDDPSETEQLARELAGAKMTVITGPFDLGTSPSVAASAGILARAGVDVVFAGSLPTRHPDSMRLTAAIAVRAGMPAAWARRALTVGASQLANRLTSKSVAEPRETHAAESGGKSERIGISAGAPADLIVFTGDPLRLDSRVSMVFVAGKRVYHAP